MTNFKTPVIGAILAVFLSVSPSAQATQINQLPPVTAPGSGDAIPAQQSADGVTRYITPGQILNAAGGATTAFTAAAVGVETTRAEAAEALKAAIASPSFTGTINYGTSAAGGSILLNGPAAAITPIYFYAGGALRWRINTVSAETGSNSGDDFVLANYSDSGTQINHALTITRATSAAAFAGAVSAPSYQSSPSNTLSTSSVPSWNLNIYNVSGGIGSSTYSWINNGVSNDASTSGGTTVLNNYYTFGGNTHTGGSQVASNYMNQVSATAAQSSTYYQVLQNLGYMNYSAGGTSGTPLGRFYGVSDVFLLNSGATNYAELVGESLTYGAMVGSSTQKKIGLGINTAAEDAVQGSVEDAALEIGAANTALVGSNFGIQFGDNAESYPELNTIIGTGYTGQGYAPTTLNLTSQYGVDFSAVDFTGDAWRSAGSKIDGRGDYQVGPGSLSWSPAGLTLAATGEVGGTIGESITPVAGGTGWVNGSIVTTGNGDLYTANVTSGAITSLTVIVPATSQGAPPVNPLAIYGNSGLSATVDLTWTPATTLNLNGGSPITAGLISAGNLSVISGTLPTNGLDHPGVGQLGFVSNSTAAGDIDTNQNWRIGGATTPTVSGCGTSPSIAGNNQGFLLTVGTGTVTSCTVTFAGIFAAAPRELQFSPANSTAAAQGTTLAYVSGLTASTFTLSGATLAGAAYYVQIQ